MIASDHDEQQAAAERSRRIQLRAQLFGLAISVGLTLWGLVSLTVGGNWSGWIPLAAGLVTSVMVGYVLFLWFRIPPAGSQSEASGEQERIDP